MVGIAAWGAGESPSPTARILAAFVRPLFAGMGMGRLLVEHTDGDAGAAGYHALNLTATLNAAEFFETLGYWITGNGGWALPVGREIRVVFILKVAAPEALPAF